MSATLYIALGKIWRFTIAALVFVFVLGGCAETSGQRPAVDHSLAKNLCGAGPGSAAHVYYLYSVDAGRAGDDPDEAVRNLSSTTMMRLVNRHALFIEPWTALTCSQLGTLLADEKLRVAVVEKARAIAQKDKRVLVLVVAQRPDNTPWLGSFVVYLGSATQASIDALSRPDIPRILLDNQREL